MAGSVVLQFLRRTLKLDHIPKPPERVKDVPGGYALFMDEDEREVLYAKPWPHVGCPQDDSTLSTTWQIDGKRYYPSRRENGNWIFRRGQ